MYAFTFGLSGQTEDVLYTFTFGLAGQTDLYICTFGLAGQTGLYIFMFGLAGQAEVALYTFTFGLFGQTDLYTFTFGLWTDRRCSVCFYVWTVWTDRKEFCIKNIHSDHLYLSRKKIPCRIHPSWQKVFLCRQICPPCLKTVCTLFLCVVGSACYFCVLQGLRRPAKEQKVHQHNPPLPPNDQHALGLCIPSPSFCPFYPPVLLCNYQLSGIWIFISLLCKLFFC